MTYNPDHKPLVKPVSLTDLLHTTRPGAPAPRTYAMDADGDSDGDTGMSPGEHAEAACKHMDAATAHYHKKTVTAADQAHAAIHTLMAKAHVQAAVGNHPAVKAHLALAANKWTRMEQDDQPPAASVGASMAALGGAPAAATYARRPVTAGQISEHMRAVSADHADAEHKMHQLSAAGDTKGSYHAEQLRSVNRGMKHALGHIRDAMGSTRPETIKSLHTKAASHLEGASHALKMAHDNYNGAPVSPSLRELHARTVANHAKVVSALGSHGGSTRDLKIHGLEIDEPRTYSEVREYAAAAKAALQQYGYNPRQPRAQDGKWTGDSVASASPADHDAEAARHSPDSSHHVLHKLMSQGKSALAAGNKAQGEHALMAAGDIASREDSKTAGHFQEGLKRLADQHNLPRLGEYTGAIAGAHVPSRMQYASNPAGRYSEGEQNKVVASAQDRAQHADGKERTAYKAIAEGADHLASAHASFQQGKTAEGNAHVARAAKIAMGSALVDSKTGDYHSALGAHAQALAGHLNESVGYMEHRS